MAQEKPKKKGILARALKGDFGSLGKRTEERRKKIREKKKSQTKEGIKNKKTQESNTPSTPKVSKKGKDFKSTRSFSKFTTSKPDTKITYKKESFTGGSRRPLVKGGPGDRTDKLVRKTRTQQSEHSKGVTSAKSTPQPVKKEEKKVDTKVTNTPKTEVKKTETTKTEVKKDRSGKQIRNDRRAAVLRAKKDGASEKKRARLEKRAKKKEAIGSGKRKTGAGKVLKGLGKTLKAVGSTAVRGLAGAGGHYVPNYSLDKKKKDK